MWTNILVILIVGLIIFLAAYDVMTLNKQQKEEQLDLFKNEKQPRRKGVGTPTKRQGKKED